MYVLPGYETKYNRVLVKKKDFVALVKLCNFPTNREVFPMVVMAMYPFLRVRPTEASPLKKEALELAKHMFNSITKAVEEEGADLPGDEPDVESTVDPAPSRKDDAVADIITLALQAKDCLAKYLPNKLFTDKKLKELIANVDTGKGLQKTTNRTKKRPFVNVSDCVPFKLYKIDYDVEGEEPGRLPAIPMDTTEGLIYYIILLLLIFRESKKNHSPISPSSNGFQAIVTAMSKLAYSRKRANTIAGLCIETRTVTRKDKNGKDKDILQYLGWTDLGKALLKASESDILDTLSDGGKKKKWTEIANGVAEAL